MTMTEFASKAPELLGLLGSVALAIPSFKHMYTRWQYKVYFDVPANRPETQAFDDATKDQMRRRAQESYCWDSWDASFTFLGGVFLSLSFLLSLLT